MENRHSKFEISCNEQVLYRTGKSFYPHILLSGYVCGTLACVSFCFFTDGDLGIKLLLLIAFIVMLFVEIKMTYTQKDNEVQITDRGVYWYVDGLNGFIAHENVERYGFHAEYGRTQCEIYLEIVAKDNKCSQRVLLTYTKYSLKMINEILSKYNKGQQLQGKPKVRWDFAQLLFSFIAASPFVIPLVLWISGVI